MTALALAPEQETAKLHLSPSSLKMFLRCPASYMFRYMYRIKTQPKSYLTKGRALHKGIEVNFVQKINSHEDLPLKDVQDATADEFEKQATETAWEEGEDMGKIKDETINLATLYHAEIAPTIQPLMVEQKIVVDIPETDYQMVGILDLVDDQLNIRDAKHYGRTPNENDIAEDLQLTTYSFLYRGLTGKVEAGVHLDCLIETKVPKVVHLSSSRSEKDINRLLNISRTVIHAIDTGCFYPNPTGFMCSEKNCDYWQMCHRDF